MTREPTYKWWVVAMLWSVCLFNYADRQAIFSVFPVLKAQFGLSDVELGVVGASFMWMYALFGPVAGWLGDRFERKTIIIFALIFWSAATAATSLCHTFWELTLVRSLGGLGEAFYFPAAMSLISDYHGRKTRSRAMSLHQSSVYAGTITGGTVAGYVAQYYSWRSSFVLFGAVGCLLGIMLAALLKEPQRGQLDTGGEKTGTGYGGVRDGLKEIFRSRMVAVLCAVFVGANFVAVVFLTWMPSFLYRKFYMSLTMAGLNGTVFIQIAAVLGVLSGGMLADRLAGRHRGGRMLTQAIGLIGGVPFLFLTGWTRSLPLLMLAMTAFGYFKGLYDANIFASLYDVVEVRRRAAAAGILNSIGWLGGGLAPVVIARASESFGMSASISATCAIYFGIACLLLWGVKTHMSERPLKRSAGL
jgi:MFS family permease